MPTGYTADVESGEVTEFRIFALRCARAFGATIMQRDDPMKDEPKHREPSDYNAKQLVEARATLKRLSKMTPQAADREAAKDYNRAMSSYEESRRRNETENARYDAMTEKVRAWQPPTPDHKELQAFMLEQLRISRHTWVPTAPTKQTGGEWLRRAIERATKDVAYHEKGQAEEQERCAGANAWIDALYASLNEPARTP